MGESFGSGNKLGDYRKGTVSLKNISKIGTHRFGAPKCPVLSSVLNHVTENQTCYMQKVSNLVDTESCQLDAMGKYYGREIWIQFGEKSQNVQRRSQVR